MQSAVINAKGLSKRYANLIALDDVSFLVERPSVVGLVGPNGSGKTTMLRLLMGAIRPTGGDVSLFGTVPYRSTLLHRSIGYLSASDRLIPDLTVHENMIYRSKFYGMEANEAAATGAKLLRERGLHFLRDRFPPTLSTGQRRQVSLLSTIMHRPKLLLLDEPTTGIDIMAINQIYTLLEDLCAQATTIVLATHHIDELIALCERTIALHDGQLVHDGLTSNLGATRAEVRASIQHLFSGRVLVAPQPEVARMQPLSTPVEQAHGLSLVAEDPLPRFEVHHGGAQHD